MVIIDSKTLSNFNFTNFSNLNVLNLSQNLTSYYWLKKQTFNGLTKLVVFNYSNNYWPKYANTYYFKDISTLFAK